MFGLTPEERCGETLVGIVPITGASAFQKMMLLDNTILFNMKLRYFSFFVNLIFMPVLNSTINWNILKINVQKYLCSIFYFFKSKIILKLTSDDFVIIIEDFWVFFSEKICKTICSIQSCENSQFWKQAPFRVWLWKKKYSILFWLKT